MQVQNLMKQKVFLKTKLFSETLLNISGEKVDTEKIGEKYVGIYFSASWCGPCRNLLLNL